MLFLIVDKCCPVVIVYTRFLFFGVRVSGLLQTRLKEFL